MLVSISVVTVVLILNILGIFIVDMTQMVIAYISTVILLAVPTLLVKAMKIETKSYTKYVIVSCAVLFVGIFTVIMSKHAVLLFVYPIAISSLYFSGKLNIIATILTIITVSAAQLISFYIPCDKDANSTTLKRVVLFGILPRAMILFAISLIFTMLCKRTAAMLGSLMSAEQQDMLREKSAEISRTLVNAVAEMDTLSAQSSEFGRTVAQESEQVLRDTEANSEHIRSVKENMSTISESLKELDTMSREIGRLLEDSEKITAENDQSLSVAEKGMEEIYNHTDETMKTILSLSEQSKRISETVKKIEDISLQTDILAINASIEAAHAGAMGAGFSIVAQDIGQLSAKTKSSAQEIGNIVSQFTKNLNVAVAAMEHNFTLTRDGTENMRTIKASAEKLSSSNAEISDNSVHIAEVISGVAKSGSEVTDRLTDISENMSRNYAAVSSVSETIRNTGKSIETMDTMVKSIKEMSEQLNSLT